MLREFPRTAVFLFALASLAPAQMFTGSIQGRVTDPSGAAVSGTKLTVRNPDTGLERSELSNVSGDYLFASLPPGNYELSAEHAGFRAESMRGIVLQVSNKAQIDIALKVGQVSENVEVTASAPLVNAVDATVGQVIDDRKVADLPLNGRNFFQLALLTAGAEQRNTTRGLLAVNGTRGNSLAFLFDGVDGNDDNAIFLSMQPSIEAIQEFKIQTSTYSAEFGRNAGGQINLVSKSGGNTLHGTVFEYLRNAQLDAKNFFDPATNPIPPFKRNQFGAVVHGPIRRNRTFFLLNYEGTRIRQSQTIASPVPTALERVGNFSQTVNLQTGALLVVRDPITKLPFPNNIIPTARIDPTGLKVAALYPLPNRAGASNFVSAPTDVTNADVGTARVDQRITDKDTFFARYFITNSAEYNPFGKVQNSGGVNIPGFPVNVPVRGQNLALNYTRVLSPASVLELRFGVHRYATGRFQDNSIDGSTELGIGGTSRKPIDLGYPQFTVTGYATLGDRTDSPQSRPQNTFHYFGNYSHVIGNHSLKAGAEARRLQQNQFVDNNVRGLFAFTAANTANGLGDMLLGLPNTAQIASAGFGAAWRETLYGLYLQDDWKVSARLTINLGVRYEYWTPQTDKYDKMAIFDFGDKQIKRVGTNGIPRAGIQPDKDNIGPRVGFAWSPFGGTRTIVRGGYGIFFDKENNNTMLGLLQQPLFTVSTQWQQPGTISNVFAGSGVTPPPGVSAYQGDLQNAYYQQWNLTLEREVTKGLVLAAGWVGSKGTELPGSRDINQPLPGPGAAQARRPLQQYGVITFRYSGMSEIYHSLQLRAEKRFSHGLTFLLNYTFSKGIDDGPVDGGSLQNAYNTRESRGLSNTDSPHRFNGSFLYELPFFHGHRYVGGWQLNGIVSLLSGIPFTPTISQDIAGVGTTNQRPNRIGFGTLAHPSPDRWFDPAAFRVPAAFTFGNSGRNILFGPGLQTVDLSTFKDFAIREKQRLQFRAEFFNVLNHPNFGQPATAIDAVNTVGTISTAQASRQIEFALKYIW